MDNIKTTMEQLAAKLLTGTVQPGEEIKDFVIGNVKYREISLTPDILPQFILLDCDDIAHQESGSGKLCHAKKNILIGLAGGYWRLFHRGATDEDKLKGSVKSLSNAPLGGVNMHKLASEDRGVAEAELAKLRAEVAADEEEKSGLALKVQMHQSKPSAPDESYTTVYLEVSLTPEYAALFRNVMCNTCIYLISDDPFKCDEPKSLLIRPSSGDYRLIHSDAEGKAKLAGPWRSVAPQGVDIPKLIAMGTEAPKIELEQVTRGKIAKIFKIRMSDMKDEDITFSPNASHFMKNLVSKTIKPRSLDTAKSRCTSASLEPLSNYVSPYNLACLKRLRLSKDVSNARRAEPSTSSPKLRQQVQRQAQQSQSSSPTSLLGSNTRLEKCDDEGEKKAPVGGIERAESITQERVKTPAKTTEDLGEVQTTQSQPSTKTELPPSHPLTSASDPVSTKQSHAQSSFHPYMAGHPSIMNPQSPPFFNCVPPTLPPSNVYPSYPPLDLYNSPLGPMQPYGAPGPEVCTTGCFGVVPATPQFSSSSFYTSTFQPSTQQPKEFILRHPPYYIPKKYTFVNGSLIEHPQSNINDNDGGAHSMPGSWPTPMQSGIDTVGLGDGSAVTDTYLASATASMAGDNLPMRPKVEAEDFTSAKSSTKPLDKYAKIATSFEKSNTLRPTQATSATMRRANFQKAISDQLEKDKVAYEKAGQMMQKQKDFEAASKSKSEGEKSTATTCDKLKLHLPGKEITMAENQAMRDKYKGSKTEKAVSKRLKKMGDEQLEKLEEAWKENELNDWELVGEDEMDDDYVLA